MEKFLKKLRNRKTSTTSFRVASEKVCTHLMLRLVTLFKKQHVSLDNVIIVIILRSGFALLDPALRTFPNALVGVLGMKRDEHTFNPYWYYENLPSLSEKSTVVLLDPMLATGGSAEAAVLRLHEHGAKMENIYFLGIIGATEGFTRLAHFIPKENIVLAAIDKGLNAKKYIVPGLGDFGDRYFGYSGKTSSR